jgi:hypothetical protein
MLNLDLTVHLRNSDQSLAELVTRQMPFALSLALNTTMEDTRQAGRNRVRSQFTLRTPQSEKFLSLGIAVSKKATKGNLHAALQVGGAFNLGKNTRYTKLAQFEEGGVRSGGGVLGNNRIKIFDGVELIPYQKPTARALYPANLGLQQRRTIEGRMDGGALKGKRRTFVVRTGPKTGTVLQRTGKKSGEAKGPGARGGARNDPKLIRLFRIRPKVSIKARHWMLPTSQIVWDKRFSLNLDRALEHALRTAK